MTAGELTDVRTAAAELLTGLTERPHGQVSASVYETARLVTLAPWLTGHERRLEFLAATQRPDGAWGAPGAYALVPTLSATEALLTELARGAAPSGGPGGGPGRTPGEAPGGDRAVKSARLGADRLAHVADRGLAALFRLLPGLDAAGVPDTPAADLIVVALTGAINGHLGRRAANGARLHPPAGLDTGRNAKIQAALAAGVRPPEKLLHALEVAGDAARGARTVRPGPLGTVGASPAATAAWLDPRHPYGPARRFLEETVAAHGGPVPCGYPVTVFERAWVLTTLARAGLVTTAPAGLTGSLRPALAPGGTPAGEGLPADADTTSAALYALGLLGVPYRPDPLWAYRAGPHFCTWPGEDGFSVTTNAHVLEAIGLYAERRGAEPRYAATAAELAALLRDHQRADGSWHDRWHASPYYATTCCALALGRFGGAASRTAVAAAAEWMITSQRADGSWGRWLGTAEETAYAVQVLALTGAAPHGPAAAAIARARSYLHESAESPDQDAPPLWHDKDLYRPAAIVRAAVLSALHLAANYAA